MTQADLARALRAAKQAGGGVVEVAPDGTIRILPPVEGGNKPAAPLAKPGRALF